MILTGASDELPPVEPPRLPLVPLPTWMWKTPVSVAPRPSCTVYWIESLPCQPATGVYFMVPSEPNVTEPPAELLPATDVTFSVPLPLSFQEIGRAHV